MAQQSIEERLAFLESKIAEYEAERAQMRTLERLRAGQSELREIFQAHQEYVTERLDTFESHITVRLDAVDNHLTNLTEGQQELRGGQHALQAGQDQILAILTGKAKRND
jgi:hypothetical protein